MGVTAVVDCLGVTADKYSCEQGNESSVVLNLQNVLIQKRQLFSLTVIDKFKELGVIPL